MFVHAGKYSPEILDYLSRRRSPKADDLREPGPSKEQLDNILKIAARVPDHGKMCPWYFIVFAGEARKQAGALIEKSYRSANPDARDDKIRKEAERFLRAPVVVAVVCRVRKGKNPVWEQVMSAGAVCMNLSLAAHAHGFGMQWLTEWYAYDNGFKKALGLDARDHIAGFMHIGTASGQPEERDRPDMKKIVTQWRPGVRLNKGDDYDREKFDFPADGFDFTKLNR